MDLREREGRRGKCGGELRGSKRTEIVVGIHCMKEKQRGKIKVLISESQNKINYES